MQICEDLLHRGGSYARTAPSQPPSVAKFAPEPMLMLVLGLYMLGLGIGCVISSPTALIYGKRPVYLAGTAIFLASSIWAAASQSYTSLLVARILMGK